MKLGQAEGTPEEIKGFLENHGMDPKKYFEPASAPMNNAWYFLPAVLLLFAVSSLLFCNWLSPSGKTFFFILGSVAFLWGAVLSYIQAKSVWLAGGVALFGVLIMLVSMGAMSPMQMFEYANKAVESKTQASK
jgi:hypothetical protein